MPELPEVETVRRQLDGALTGKTFVAVTQIDPAMLRDCSAEELRAGLPGRRIESVGRLGKFLTVALDDGAFLTMHLGMTGQLLVDPKEPPGPHTRFLFALEGEALSGRDARYAGLLEFRDARKFGRVQLTAGGPAPRLRALGPDAWLGEWDAEYLAGRLRGRKIALKAFLLDQSHLAGIGNIYADEILWWTGLSPLRESGSLDADEIARLREEIPCRLQEGIRLLGCTLSDFVDTAGEPGEFQDWLRAYGRQGQTCSRCGGTLVRTVVGGRGTAYCPECQR
ncbi:MAG: bifunctional DNA-formamidopyrimidine glycosylase/DNA-(apurinic or apyrimidinic site) lyase [Thermoleophilia bacterium]|nr:bifunctional DNA-formamidopyrimidine glycosylase/DNA-(apurinic or apyrimidinic site) lyase [Thermoleophilia bacterium]